MAWLGTVFVGESALGDETKHMELRKKLLEESAVVKLDEPIVEGEVVQRQPALPDPSTRPVQGSV